MTESDVSGSSFCSSLGSFVHLASLDIFVFSSIASSFGLSPRMKERSY